MALPKPTAAAHTERRVRGQRADVRDFLKAQHIGKVGERATIQIAGNVRLVDGNYGEQVVMDCEYDGGKYVFAVNVDTPNYTLLVERFTDDETKWFGPIDVIVKQGVSAQYLIVADSNAAGSAQGTETPRRRRSKR